MPNLGDFVRVSKAAIALCGATSASADTQPVPVQFLCLHDTPPALCLALSAAISETFAHYDVELVQGMSPNHVSNAQLVIWFETRRDTSNILAGRLAWRMLSGGQDHGLDLELTVVDQTIQPALLTDFALQLVSFADFPDL